MPKRKGLGRDVNKSLEIMEDLYGSLKSFCDMPLKKGLSSNKVDNPDLNKTIQESKAKAFELRELVDDLKNHVKKIKVDDKNSRFASKVVANFLKNASTAE